MILVKSCFLLSHYLNWRLHSINQLLNFQNVHFIILLKHLLLIIFLKEHQLLKLWSCLVQKLHFIKYDMLQLPQGSLYLKNQFAYLFQATQKQLDHLYTDQSNEQTGLEFILISYEQIHELNPCQYHLLLLGVHQQAPFKTCVVQLKQLICYQQVLLLQISYDRFGTVDHYSYQQK